jgi:hypothetical protein
LDPLGLLAAVALITLRLLCFSPPPSPFHGVVDFLLFMKILFFVIVVRAPECKESVSKFKKYGKILIMLIPHTPSEIFLLLELDFADNTCASAILSPNGIK